MGGRQTAENKRCKINNINIKNDIYNGKCKLIVANRDFMTRSDVWECMSQLKNKKCEGYDRIPVCCLLDARHALIEPIAAFLAKFTRPEKSQINGKFLRLSLFIKRPENCN